MGHGRGHAEGARIVGIGCAEPQSLKARSAGLREKRNSMWRFTYDGLPAAALLHTLLLVMLLPQLPAVDLFASSQQSAQLKDAIPAPSRAHLRRTEPLLLRTTGVGVSTGETLQESTGSGCMHTRLTGLRGGGKGKSLHGIGIKSKRGKDPPMFRAIDICNMMTNGQYGRDKERFEYALAHDGKLPTLEDLQEGTAGAPSKPYLEQLKRRAFGVPEAEDTGEEDGAGTDTFRDDSEEEKLRNDQVTAYRELQRHSGSVEDYEVSSDLDDDMYIWCPQGPEESPVQAAAFEAFRGNTTQGILFLEEHVQSHPNDTEALTFLATALISAPNLARYPEADCKARSVQMMEHAVSVAPTNLNLVSTLAAMIAHQHNFTSPVPPHVAASPALARAQALFEQVLAAPDRHGDVPTLNNYAVLLTNVRRNHTGAEAVLLHAINSDRSNIASLGNYARLLIDHFPHRRYIEPPAADLMGPSYNLTGLGLARELTLKALRLDPTHAWVREFAPRILAADHPCQQDYLSQFDGLRPSAFVHLPGHGMVPPDLQLMADAKRCDIEARKAWGQSLDLFEHFDEP